MSHLVYAGQRRLTTARDPILIDATLNCLAILIRTRPAVANKILSAILNFNPFRSAPTSMTPRLLVIYRSMERTTFALLKFIMKSMPNHAMSEKIHAYMIRLQQQRVGIFSGGVGVKRSAEAMDGPNDAKRQRLTEVPKFPPMPPPPNTVAQLFTLTEDTMLHQFDVKLLPIDIVNQVVALLIQMTEAGRLEPAIDAVRMRLDKLKKAAQPTPIPDIPMAGPTGIDDDDDYEPDFGQSTEAAAENATTKVLEELIQPPINLGPFVLPKPPPLSDSEVAILSDQTIRHVLGLVHGLESTNAVAARPKMGFARLAAAANDRDAWITIISRIAARTPASIDEYAESDASPDSDGDGTLVKASQSRKSDGIAGRIREHLFMYILEDFRSRLNIAISWLTEEWYADKMQARSNSPSSIPTTDLTNYSEWSARLFDRVAQYLDKADSKLLIRFLSEIPAITKAILDSLKTLAQDPERVSMCTLAMQYLLMFRPPSRDLVKEALAEMIEAGDEQVKSAAAKVLERFEKGQSGSAAPAKPKILEKVEVAMAPVDAPVAEVAIVNGTETHGEKDTVKTE
jgi:symplekin